MRNYQLMLRTTVKPRCWLLLLARVYDALPPGIEVRNISYQAKPISHSSFLILHSSFLIPH